MVIYVYKQNDGWRQGPTLEYRLKKNPMMHSPSSNESDDDGELDDDDDEMDGEFSATVATGYTVYSLVIGDGSTKVAHFQQCLTAEDYCLWMFEKRNNHGPFRPNGEYSSSYHPKGSHAPLTNWPKGKWFNEETTTTKVDNTDWYLVVNQGEIQGAYCMNGCSVW